MAEQALDGITTAKAEVRADSASMKIVVAASSAGTAFEWYDFFIFGTLTAIIARNFFAGLNETAGYILALGAFSAGFVFRPLGAAVFGWIGDKVGRKGAFLITVTVMGVATIGIGLLPTYRQIGLGAPALLILLRIIQGFALGGEYGGAAIYVAEHAPVARRGHYTGWIQISASLGLIGALAIILITRKLIGEAAFGEWGWRVPFLFSAVLLGVSLWMRSKLGESPAFKAMQAAHGGSRAPLAESFLTWRYLKVVLVVLFGIMIAQGAVWYAVFFYAQFFMEKVIKLESASVNTLMIVVTIATAPLYVLFSDLSDRIGRKPVMLAGMILAVVFFFPGFHLLTQAGNPALAQATERTPVTVIADPADCSAQFDPVGKAAFLSSCDIPKSVLANAGISYRNQSAPAGAGAVIRIGTVEVASQSAKGLSAADAKAVKAVVEGRVKAALAKAGYPAAADPKAVNWGLLLAVMMVFAIAATALYGPIASALVELFPTRIRYTALSVPYNIGTGWIGGFLPALSFAMVAANGDMYFGLWYPVAITVVAVAVALLFLPETKGRDLYTEI